MSPKNYQMLESNQTGWWSVGLLHYAVKKHTAREKFIVDSLKKKQELLFSAVTSLVSGVIRIEKHSFVLIFYILGTYILVSNVFGMIPGVMTITSHLILTLFLSLSFFVGNNLIGLLRHKEQYFGLFLPEGVPLAIVPFLILIEVVSYFSRVFSLAIRLFANMMSGHILLKILISFL